MRTHVDKRHKRQNVIGGILKRIGKKGVCQ